MTRKELSLDEIRTVACSILRHFSQFCKDNDLNFYLSNGTLLGAIKYRGFIPWDDDIDVLMPRKDYDKFVEIYKDSEKFRLFTYERNSHYKFSYAKLCDMNTLKVEFNIDSGIDLGIDIDIFPLDFCSESILASTIQRKLAIYQRGCILSKFISSAGRPSYKRIIIFGCKLFGFDFFYKKLDKVVKRETSKGDSYVGCLMWPIYGRREIIPAQAFLNHIDVEFEGCKYSAPIGYDVYLRSLYGEYEKDPPVEKQRSHHKFKAYRIER